MKKSALLQILAMGAMMGSSNGFSSPYTKPTSRKLCGIKHIGDIPKGCRLVVCNITIPFKDISISIDVDIVSGSEKAFNKKLLAKRFEIETYIQRTPLDVLSKDERFKIVANEQEVENI